MGSIQAFPRRARAGTLADVWRMVPMPGQGLVHVRTALPEDFALLHGLHRRAHPDRPAIAMKALESQRHHFPEGQLVAECAGQLVGAATSLIVDWERHAVWPRRASLTADETFATHEPSGGTLFAADLFVDVSRRGGGVGRALMQARRQLARRLNLRRIVTAVPLTGYAAAAGRTPEDFVARIVMGDLPLPGLRFQLAQGFQLFAVARDYDPTDLASGGHAALLVWLNPSYTPPAPPAQEEGHAMRKCA
jgi:GNAT superfamily N-acetyltransferase